MFFQQPFQNDNMFLKTNNTNRAAMEAAMLAISSVQDEVDDRVIHAVTLVEHGTHFIGRPKPDHHNMFCLIVCVLCSLARVTL